MLERPTDPLDRQRLPRLTVFGAPWCEDTAITRSRLEALNVPFLYVDLETDARADAYVRGLHDGHRITPTVVVGVEEAMATEPDLATVDRLAALAWPDLPIERPSLSAPLSPDAEAAEFLVTPHGLVEVSTTGQPEGLSTEPSIPTRWGTGPSGRRALVLLAHGGGCLACLGYAKRLIAQGGAFAEGGATAVVVAADQPEAVIAWRRDLPPAARVLADPAAAWQRRTLDRLISQSGAPGSLIRFAVGGVALLVIDGSGRVRRLAAGPEAGYLPDPGAVADAITLEEARDSLRLGGPGSGAA